MDAGLGAIQEHVPPDMPTFNVLFNDTWSIALIAPLCGLSVLLILLWLVAVLEYTSKTKASRLNLTRSHSPCATAWRDLV